MSMQFFRRTSALAVVLCVGLAARVLAADTGSVSGAVFDDKGTPIGDVIVKISGDVMPAGRTVKTDANGMYRFALLIPGKYTVESDKPGIGKTSRPVIVEVDKDTQVDLVLGLAVTEELT